MDKAAFPDFTIEIIRRSDAASGFKILSVESFNGSFRDECLNETLFSSLAQARTDITEWKEDYNRNRPHSSLGNITPNEFAMKIALEKQAA
ncbi:integrase core domain-containing protein [Rhizobium giardinii]